MAISHEPCLAGVAATLAAPARSRRLAYLTQQGLTLAQRLAGEVFCFSGDSASESRTARSQPGRWFAAPH